MPTSVAIATIPSHVSGDTFTVSMWDALQNDINQGIVDAVGCTVQRLAFLNVADSTATTVTFDTDAKDDYGMWVSGSATQITCKATGWHALAVSLIWAAQATSNRIELHIQVNGSDVAVAGGALNGDGTHVSYLNGATPWYLTVGDVVTLQVTQRSGAALHLNTTTMSVVRV